MKLVVNEVIAVNDSVVRVDCFTYSGDLNDADNKSYRWYQLALGVDTFLQQNEDGSMGILGDKFQEALTTKLIQTRNVAELAHILTKQEFSWDIETSDIPTVPTDTTPSGVEGMKLAHGN